MSILRELVGKVVDITMTSSGAVYVLPSCTIMSVDTEWVSYKVPEGEQALIRQEDIISIKVRG